MQIILKVASRCNLNCTYCYVYNKGDSTWMERPVLMSDEVFEAALERTLIYCRQHTLRRVSLTFHGGEPCLLGTDRFAAWCRKAREHLDELQLDISIQTNGTLIDERWVDTFIEHRVGVGVSIDGPVEVHDRARVDHAGRGSHARVVAAVGLLNRGGVTNGLLCVIPLGADPVVVHRHLTGLGAPMLTYLLPDHTHDTIAAVREEFGETPCADFLIPVFDEWWFNQTLALEVRDVWNMARVIMGGESLIETIGNRAPHYYFIETDGTIEDLDALRVCEPGIARTPHNIRTSSLNEVRRAGGFHAAAMLEGLPLPGACRGCEEESTCAGGHLPHRYSRSRGFDNRSAWCADLKKVLAHIRLRLGVTPEETNARRRALREQRELVSSSRNLSISAENR